MKSHRSVINDHQFSPGEIKSQIKFYSQILQFVKITVIHNGNKAILLNQNKNTETTQTLFAKLEDI